MAKLNSIKITELHQVPKSKVGKVAKNGVKPEPGEEGTFEYLALFGFNIELIKPTNTQKVRNPDILIEGMIWEVKTPTSFNENTIKMRFRMASKQATKVIFDLRGIKKNALKVEKQIIDMFKNDGRVRRMMVIRKDGKILDIIK